MVTTCVGLATLGGRDPRRGWPGAPGSAGPAGGLLEGQGQGEAYWVPVLQAGCQDLSVLTCRLFMEEKTGEEGALQGINDPQF